MQLLFLAPYVLAIAACTPQTALGSLSNDSGANKSDTAFLERISWLAI